MRRLALCLALVLATVPPAFAQAPAARVGRDRWQITMENGDILWDLRFLKLEGEHLVVRSVDSLSRVPLKRMKEIRLLQKSEFRLGTGAGGAMAALMGTDDEIYDLSPLDFAARRRAVEKILVMHPPADETAN